MSFAAFMYYYAHFLDPFGDGSASPASPRSRDPETPILLLAGYSYGGLITTLLPSVQTMLAPLERPAAGSAAAEIRLRAASLAHSQNTVLSSARAAALLPKSPSSPHRKTLGVRVGGDEELGRSSHDARRSFSLEETMSDLVARAMSGVAKSHHDKKSGSAESAAAAPTTPTKKAKKKHVLSPPSPPHHSPSDEGGSPTTSTTLPAIPNLPRVRPAYLLVSPPMGVIGNLATMSFPPLFPSLLKKFRRETTVQPPGPAVPSSSSEGDEETPAETCPRPDAVPDADEAERKLAANPTLAIYGDADGFLNNKRVRAWAARLRGVEGSRFAAHEVSTAGHFWREGRTLYVLRDAVVAFAEGLLRGEE